MGKRKKHTGNRNAFDNPLAAARSGKSTTTNAPQKESAEVDWIDFENSKQNSTAIHKNDKLASKVNKKAEQIWHRRSGAGFHLFVEYYLGQPDGIVAFATSESSPHEQSPQPTQVTSTISSEGAGQSRAALRRKKKKRRKTNPSDNVNNLQEDGVNAATNQPVSSPPTSGAQSYRHKQLLYSGRLLDVLSSKSKSIPKGTSNCHTSSGSFREFLIALSKPLPLTFRFRRYETAQKYHSNIIPSYKQRNQRIQKIKGLRQILKGQTLAKTNVKPVPFDPDYIYQAIAPPGNNAHPFPVDKSCLKRVCPQLKEFLNEHTSDGTIARQELGSMLPVWLLDKVGAFSSSNLPLRVLDTCASPGSKTLQVAELVSISKGGRVRANDVNANRLESLQEALIRSGFFVEIEDNESDSDSEGQGAVSMESLVRFSNVDASRYPIPKSEAKKYPIILCDVPCSGDGTVRKDVHVIPNWTPSISNALHSLQVKILVRALNCVALNGVVSYSTCSLNPIEDEAVVRTALEIEEKDGKFGFELIQVSQDQLNGLIMRNGVFSWRVAEFDPSKAQDNKSVEEKDYESIHGENNGAKSDDEPPAQLQWYDSYQQALDGGMEDALESMWPKCGDSPSKSPPLDRCLRLLPQDQDTGGFFVALIRRIK